MWMSTRFAQWEVEGEVRLRVNNALPMVEQERQARTAQTAGGKQAHARVLSSVHAGLRWLAGRAVSQLDHLHEGVGRSLRRFRVEARG
jgi:hypothetical protein